MLNSKGQLSSQQLIMQSSLYILEKMLKNDGYNTDILWSSNEYWGDLGPVLEKWIDQVADGLAYAALCSLAIFDFEAVVIDGAIPINVREKIVLATQIKLSEADHRGINRCEVKEILISKNQKSILDKSLKNKVLITTYDDWRTARGERGMTFYYNQYTGASTYNPREVAPHRLIHLIRPWTGSNRPPLPTTRPGGEVYAAPGGGKRRRKTRRKRRKTLRRRRRGRKTLRRRRRRRSH